MKKTMITMAIMIASLVGFSASAQTQTTCPVTGQTCVQSDSTCSGHKQKGKKGKKQRMKRKFNRGGGMKLAFDALQGIELTDNQKAKIYDIREKYAKPTQVNGQRPDRDAMKQRHQELLAEIKAVLNADQVKQYEENLETMKTQVLRTNRGGHHGNIQQYCNPDSSVCRKKK